ncbi:MAG: PCRF domain-containing protein, partial [Chloroflexi bacterium]|nr:PCRF domain-containing protein [Chloroflexota bacterium]
MTMLDRLVSIEGRYDDIDKLMADPEVSVNFARVQGLAKEQAAIRKVVEISREYRAVIQQLDETHALIREESDPEMVAFAKDEEADLEKRKAKLETDLRV